MARQRIHYGNVLEAKASTGASNAFFCSDFRNLIAGISAPANSTFTIKFVGGVGDTAPDFTAAQSTTNKYDFLEAIDLQDGSAIDGDTGVTIDNTTAAVNNRLFEININALDYVGIQVTSWTDGSVSAVFTMTTNQ